MSAQSEQGEREAIRRCTLVSKKNVLIVKSHAFPAKTKHTLGPLGYAFSLFRFSHTAVTYVRVSRSRKRDHRVFRDLFRGGGICFFLELELQISTPRSLKKPVQFPRYAEIRQNNSRKNCGKDLNSTLWFAPFYCRSVRGQSRDY